MREREKRGVWDVFGGVQMVVATNSEHGFKVCTLKGKKHQPSRNSTFLYTSYTLAVICSTFKQLGLLGMSSNSLSVGLVAAVLELLLKPRANDWSVLLAM